MIEVIRTGQFTSIQDLGRFGYRAKGVPVSGPMDRSAAYFANQLLGNDANASLIEMSLTGATLHFRHAATLALCGAKCQIKIDSKIAEVNGVFRIEANSTLSFGAITLGNYLYLAVRGGFMSPIILGSACYLGGLTEESCIQRGQEIQFKTAFQEFKPSGSSVKLASGEQNDFIEVEKGPEFHLLSETDIQELSDSIFHISTQSNRMGFLLEGKVSVEMKEIITSPVQPGTVQLTPGGQLIVLMRDAQTTGGYSRIFQLTPSSINQLAQKQIGKGFKVRILD